MSIVVNVVTVVIALPARRTTSAPTTTVANLVCENFADTAKHMDPVADRK